MASLGVVPANRLDDQFSLIEFGDHAQHFATMAKQDPEPVEVLVRQFGNDAKINPILGKAQRVLPKPKLLEPVRNLLHWPHHSLVAASRILDHGDENVIPIFSG